MSNELRYGLTKEITFEAAHRLPNHPGKCKRLHGHSYRVIADVKGEKLHDDGSARQGMLIDTSELECILRDVVTANLCHYFLNEVPGLENPTTEIVARWIWERVAPRVQRSAPPGVIFETKIRMHEGFTSYAEFPA